MTAVKSTQTSRRAPRPVDGRSERASGRREEEAALERIARLRAVLGRLSRRLRPTRAGGELTASQISVLFTVVRSGPIALASLAEVEGLNPTMLSRITAQLCAAGLLTRETDPSDRRAATVAATPAGVRLRERIHRERTQALAEHVQALEEGEREALWAALPVLERLAESLPGGAR